MNWSDEELDQVSRRAYELYRQGRYHEALVVFRGLKALAPENPYFQDAVRTLQTMLDQHESAEQLSDHPGR